MFSNLNGHRKSVIALAISAFVFTAGYIGRDFLAAVVLAGRRVPILEIQVTALEQRQQQADADTKRRLDRIEDGLEGIKEDLGYLVKREIERGDKRERR